MKEIRIQRENGHWRCGQLKRWRYRVGKLKREKKIGEKYKKV